MRSAGRRSLADHPARFVVVTFVVAIAVGAGLLLLPFSTASGRSTSVVHAIFMATSAVCVTGLSSVDFATQWTGFGQLVLIVLAQLGGLGFMTMASLIAMVVSQRLGLRMTLATTTERSTLALGDVRRVLRGVALVTLVVEVLTATVLALRFRSRYDYPWDDAVWHGVFHAVSAFNNAGMALYADSFNRFATDPVVTGALMVAIVIGGLGFPVLVDLQVNGRRGWRHLTLHSRLTLAGTGALLGVGWLMVTGFEWGNRTLAGYGTLEKAWVGLFGAVTPRTAGFHTMFPAEMTDEGLLTTIGLMFVGAGSAGTSGGIKVGTFALLALVVLAELRGDPDVAGFRRRVPTSVQRQAVTVVLLASAACGVVTLALLWLTEFPLHDVAFEAVSAFGTVGLSTGITPDLTTPGHLLVSMMMLLGRVGPVTLGTALILRVRSTRIRHPEEAPLIG
jgi:Trk-type K+ transport system membrane component